MNRRKTSVLILLGMSLGYGAALVMRPSPVLASPENAEVSPPPQLPELWAKGNAIIDERGMRTFIVNGDHWFQSPYGEFIMDFYFGTPDPRIGSKIVTKHVARLVMTEASARKLAADLQSVPAKLDEYDQKMSKLPKGESSKPDWGH